MDNFSEFGQKKSENNTIQNSTFYQLGIEFALEGLSISDFKAESESELLEFKKGYSEGVSLTKNFSRSEEKSNNKKM